VGKCIADCLLTCLDNLAQYFNRWAFTYIGKCYHPPTPRHAERAWTVVKTLRTVNPDTLGGCLVVFLCPPLPHGPAVLSWLRH
jgi:hypothetical protein